MHRCAVVKLTARAGMTIRAATGLEGLGVPDRMSTIFFNAAMPGDRLRLVDDRYLFNVATYAPAVDDKYIFTYSYQPDESWTTYNGDLTGDTYRQGDYTFERRCYFRLCFKRVDGAAIAPEEASRVGEIVTFASGSHNGPAEADKAFIYEESRRLLARIEGKRTAGSLLFALLADSHYTVNGTWDDTLASLKAVHGMAGFDGIIHLGDFTDGTVTADATREYAGEVIGGLKSMGVPLYVAIGNHDTNYFMGNAEPFTMEEQCGLYLSHADGYMSRERGKPWYFKDFPEHGLRFVFLYSFDYTKAIRYTYTPECLRWLAATLSETPPGYGVIVFNHIAPLVKLQYWVNRINGSKRLVDILEGYNAGVGAGGMLAFINGHNHADQVYHGLSFPVVSVGCAKLEYFTNYKPKGSHTAQRIRGEASQELWDALVVTPREGRLDFLRFGAGEDRDLQRRDMARHP